ncbi:TauD/TfdA family dioxygenase [Kordia sp.]|uniref:TauD/TfdA family dioxygenase n=1 Tax=Kordia sp. TaxID=1965332 RepID=UPI003D267AA6
MNRLARLKNIKVKEVTNQEEVSTSFFDGELQFPLVKKPMISGLNLRNWIEKNLTKFNSNLLKHGAILCRDFKINTVEKFQHLMTIFPNDLLEYKMRSSPRYSLTDNVYVSTTYPEDQTIQMHSESSYAPNHPERIVFCCITAAIEQGETPIADNRIIIANLSEATKAKFLEKGVQYRRNLSGLLGLNWQEVFQTSNKQDVEEECKRTGMNFEWKDEETLILTWTKKAIWNHPTTNEEIWFNHGLFFNKYMLDESVLNSVNSFDDLPNDTFFGDGTEISKEEIEEIKNAYEKATITFPWEEGDVLFLDNMLFSHGRRPYKGERKIIVSIS